MNEADNMDETTEQPEDPHGTIFLLLIFGYVVMDFMIPVVMSGARSADAFVRRKNSPTNSADEANIY